MADRRISVRLGADLVEALEAYRDENNLANNSEAIRSLIRSANPEDNTQDRLARIEEKVDALSQTDISDTEDTADDAVDEEITDDEDTENDAGEIFRDGELRDDISTLPVMAAKNTEIKETPGARVPVIDAVLRHKEDAHEKTDWNHTELREFIQDILDVSRPTADRYISRLNVVTEHPFHDDNVWSRREAAKARWRANEERLNRMERDEKFKELSIEDIVDADPVYQDFPDYVTVNSLSPSPGIGAFERCHSLLRTSYEVVNDSGKKRAIKSVWTSLIEYAAEEGVWSDEKVSNLREAMANTIEKVDGIEDAVEQEARDQAEELMDAEQRDPTDESRGMFGEGDGSGDEIGADSKNSNSGNNGEGEKAVDDMDQPIRDVPGENSDSGVDDSNNGDASEGDTTDVPTRSIGGDGDR